MLSTSSFVLGANKRLDDLLFSNAVRYSSHEGTFVVFTASIATNLACCTQFVVDLAYSSRFHSQHFVRRSMVPLSFLLAFEEPHRFVVRVLRQC